jgi:rare lipoprotein A
VIATLAVLAYGCATTRAPRPVPDVLEGVASWYGEEFAGRTTANGEIFDPTLLTAAHRTLPFGTVLDITNPETNKTVRVRVNDRGPYIGGRVIDLSYAAAEKIGLVEPGIGKVRIDVVKVGSGEREPPAPFDVTIAEAPASVPARASSNPPAVAFPLPAPPAEISAGTSTTAPSEVTVESVEVQTERGGTIVRRQVSADGREIEEVPIGPADAPTATALDRQRSVPTRIRPSTRTGHFIVQVGAFSVEENAKRLLERLIAIGHPAFIDRSDLYRVRLGPFLTRSEALHARTALEATGISAMIVTE